MRLRQVLAAATVLALIAGSIYAFWSPSQKRDLIIAPINGPVR